MNEPYSAKYVVLLPSRWGWFVGMKSDPFQTGSVATQGEWAPNESALCLSFLRPGDTVLDVGANVGNSTLAFAAAVGEGGRVISFEPQRFCYSCLVANVTLNSLIHYVEPYRMAVGDAPGLVEVPTLNPLQQITNYGGVSLIDKHTTPTEQVPCLTIDSLGLPSLRLLKSDVEGMEPAVLRGARETIMRHRPIIWTECLQDRGTKDELQALFKELKYRSWFCPTGLFAPDNTRRCRHNLFVLPDGKEMQDHNVLALPEEVTPPDWVKEAQDFSEFNWTEEKK